MRITNEQIIQSARRQRETVNNRMDVAPWSRHQRPRHGLAAAIAIAASFIKVSLLVQRRCLRHELHAPAARPAALLQEA